MSEDMSAVETVVNGPAVVKFWPTAGEALGYTRAGAYFALKHNRFEVPILNRGVRHFCLRAEILKFLGVEDPLAARRDPAEREAV